MFGNFLISGVNDTPGEGGSVILFSPVPLVNYLQENFFLVLGS